MRSVRHPRRPLPRRVYWTRRLLVLGVALGLVFGVAHLLGGGVEAPSTPAAQPVGAPVASPSSGLTPTAEASKPPKKHAKTKHKPGAVKTPLAVPTGPCPDGDVRVVPSVGQAYAGKDVTIKLKLTTVHSPACDWEVTPGSVVLKLTSGTDRIWSTQDCPGAVLPASVVVRKDDETEVMVTWNGQRSDADCSRTTTWAQPGYYHAEAAAYGGDPTDAQFYLARPPRATITAKPKPSRTPSDGSTPRQSPTH